MCVCLRAQSRPKTIRACVHIHVYAPPDAIALPQALISFLSRVALFWRPGDVAGFGGLVTSGRPGHVEPPWPFTVRV